MSDQYYKYQFYINKFENKLKSVLLSGGDRLFPVWSNLFNNHGKFWRPKLLLLLAETAGSISEQALDLAVAIELLHMATITHDDIVDNSPRRRGKKSLASEYGKGAAVLIGDFLFASSYNLIIRSGNPKIWEIANQAVMQMSKAELEQELYRWEPSISESIYLKRCFMKTGSLFVLSAKAGAMAGKFPEKMIEKAGRLGGLLGLAYQIGDDLSDFFCPVKSPDKPSGIDFSRGIITLPVIYVLRKLGLDSMKKWWGRKLTREEMNDFAGFLRDHGAFSYARLKAMQYLEKAGRMIPFFSEEVNPGLWGCITQISEKIEEFA